SIARMVENGIGVAVLPERAARRYQKSMAIEIISLTDGWAPRHFTICVRSFASLPPHAKLLVEHLTVHPRALELVPSRRFSRCQLLAQLRHVFGQCERLLLGLDRK